MISITTPNKNEYPLLLEIWEASVKATHHFLTQEVIAELKPCVLQDYFPMVNLFCSLNDKQNIIGFAGVQGDKLEMLFIDPTLRGQGIGKALLNHAITQFNINYVDVNEQNAQATAFYLHHGFKIIGRSPLDGQGKPYPLLHLKLKE